MHCRFHKTPFFFVYFVQEYLICITIFVHIDFEFY